MQPQNLPKQKSVNAKLCALFLFTLTISALTPFAGFAQKIEDSKVWTTFKKSPAVSLSPEFATYSVEYDFGNLVVQPTETPEIPDRKLQKTNGDLLLKIIANKIYVTNKTVKPVTVKGRDQYYYVVTYNANYGYELIDQKNEKAIHSYRRKNGTFNTASFSTVSDLDGYMKSAFLADLIEQLQAKINKRIQYDLMEHNFDVGVTMNIIKGTTPAFTEINKAGVDFSSLVSEKPADKEAIRPLISVWEKHLANADWKGKGEINKKVANALIQNLCAAYMLTEDYGKLREKADLFDTNNSGIMSTFSPLLMFEIDPTYSGPSYSYHTIRRKDKFQNYYKSEFYSFSYDLLNVLN